MSISGGLWGLIQRSPISRSEAIAREFEAPSFAVSSTCHCEPFFLGENLVDKEFEDVRHEVAKIGADLAAGQIVADE